MVVNMKKLLVIMLAIGTIGTIIFLKSTPSSVDNAPEVFVCEYAETESEMLCNDSIVEGVFTDSRDGQQYPVIKMGDLLWTAKNLNHETGNSWCYDNENFNCEKYGRLYDLSAAKKACPCGWHLPSVKEWNELVRTVDNKLGKAGKKLKSKIFWNGTDEFGFSALPSGRYDDGTFNYVGLYSSWWTATRYLENTSISRYMNSDSDNILENNNNNSAGFSVRCVKD
jgi:uncharacterized protein (TIGR02145 family)